MTPTVTSEITHRGRLLTVEVRSYEDRDGHQVVREIVRHPGAVVIVPVLDGDRLVLIRNERVAVGARLWELPAGTLEPGEAPDRCAARELEEEAGYRAGRVTPLARFFTSPGFLDEELHLFLATELTPTGQRLEPGESIEPAILGRAEALAMIDDGRIRDGKTIAGILLWSRRREAAP